MESGSWAEWITSVATGLGAFFVVLQLDRDHERSRRENAVSLLRQWTDRQQHQTRSAVKLVQSFNLNQCKQMVTRKEIKIDTSNDLLEQVNVVFRKTGTIGTVDFDAKEFVYQGSIYLPASYSNELRFLIASYLNLIESILASWNAGIADDKIIKAQFSFLHRKQDEQLKYCRCAFQTENGGENPFPAFTNFVAEIEPKVNRPLGLLGRLLPLQN